MGATPLLVAGDYDQPGELEFSYITQKDGLSHNNIECIFKDRTGFVWFGTRNGLCRFDGYEIRVFRSDSKSGSISGDRILCLNEDTQGNLWIGTYASGLNRYDPRTGTFTSYGDSTSLSERINHIKILRRNEVWICSNDGLAVYLPVADSFRIFRHEPGNPASLNANAVYDILETRTGEIYVATEHEQIQQFHPETGTFSSIAYKRHTGYSDDYRKRIVEDRHGKLWIAANIHGLAWYDPSTGNSEIYVAGQGQLSSRVLTGDMAFDQDGRLWICTDGGGINILNPETGKFEYIRKDPNRQNSLSTDHIYTLFFDEKNILWVGTFAEGINYHNPDRYKFRHRGNYSSFLDVLNGKSVISLLEDDQGRLWAGTDGEGLFRIDPDQTIRHYTHSTASNGLTTNVITSLAQDFQGRILIGTYSGGLLALNPETGQFTRFNERQGPGRSPSSGSIWHILPDSRNRIWLGTLGTAADLFHPEKETFENFGPASGRPERIAFENVMCILEDTDGDIWFGTEGDGLYIYDGQTSRLQRIDIRGAQQLATGGIIKCLYQDRWGKIWIGTEGMGLYRLDKNSLQTGRFTTDEGLSHNIVQSVTEDSQGNFWIGTSNGLSMMNSHTHKFRNFISEDGLSGDEFNQNALIRLSGGNLALGSSRGLDIFRPEEIRINQNLPRVIFTKLSVMNHEVEPGDVVNGSVILTENLWYTEAITLSHREKIFSIGFAALNYTLPGKCRYQYMLEGFDDSWIETSSAHRQISYSNLDPGTYIFRVKASNNDGKWGNNENTLTITVLPPFYKTFWFRAFAAILIGTLIFFIYQYRLNIHRNHFLKTQSAQEKKIMALEKEKLESELQKLTFHIINRNRVLIDQKNRMLGLSVKAREPVREGLEDIISIIDEDLNDEKDWVYIEPQLDKVYNNFVSRLKEKHPDLNLSEIKIAAYVRMNLSTKEISEFMHKTIRAVENDRYRLRKKIGLESNDSLQQYLMDL